jgi:ribonuclease VapC
VLLNEPTRDQIREALVRNKGTTVMSAATVLESMMVMSSRKGRPGVESLDSFITASDIITMPIDGSQIDAARAAWLRFGKGNHPAKLNFGDCFSYALAAHLEVPLLCIGNDFAQTDLRIALV